MGVNNIRTAGSENTMQPGVHAVIESRMFAQVSDFHSSLFQQPVELALQPAAKRDDHWLKRLTVQSRHDVNRHALRAARAQHRNNMEHFNFLHDLSSSHGGDLSHYRSA